MAENIWEIGETIQIKEQKMRWSPGSVPKSPVDLPWGHGKE